MSVETNIPNEIDGRPYMPRSRLGGKVEKNDSFSQSEGKGTLIYGYEYRHASKNETKDEDCVDAAQTKAAEIHASSRMDIEWH